MEYFDFSRALEAIPDDHCRQTTFREFMLETIPRENETKGKIVDLGCGTGHFYDYVHSHFNSLEYIGVDIEGSPEARQRTRSDFSFIPYDGVSLPFEDSSVEVIFMNQVLEHIRAPHLLFPEIKRCLVDDGLLIGSVSQLEPYHSYSVMNYTFYGLCSFLDLFGLHVFKLRPGIDSNTLISRTVNKFLLEREADFEQCFFTEESVLNYAIETYFRKKKFTIQQINLQKLKITGQFSFAVKNR